MPRPVQHVVDVDLTFNGTVVQARVGPDGRELSEQRACSGNPLPMRYSHRNSIKLLRIRPARQQLQTRLHVMRAYHDACFRDPIAAPAPFPAPAMSPPDVALPSVAGSGIAATAPALDRCFLPTAVGRRQAGCDSGPHSLAGVYVCHCIHHCVCAQTAAVVSLHAVLQAWNKGGAASGPKYFAGSG